MLEKAPTPENIDSAIERMTAELNEKYDFMELTPELQEEWYMVEMEAGVARDREAAKKHLEEFMEKLESIKKTQA